MGTDLESLYTDAQSALKAKEYDRASDLLRQILKADVDYKDAAQLLARVIRLSRRRWYNDPRTWGALGVLLLVGLGIYFFPKLQGFSTQLEPTPVNLPTDTPAPTLPPPATATTTATLLPTPTPIPLTWKRVSLGQEFERDTVTALAIDPKDPEVLYAGMKNAGIFKSIDGGLSWRPAHLGLANAHVTSLLIDFQNPNILYTGTLGGIFKTEDGGESWYRIAEETYLLMDPQQSSHLYKRDSDTIYESIDQGESWETVYTSKEGCPGEILGWDIHPADGDTLFVGGGEACEPGVYLSNDRGHTWTLFAKTEIRPGGFTIHDLGLDSLTIGLDRQGNFYIFTRGSSARGTYAGVISNKNGAWRTILDIERPTPETVTFDSTGLIYFNCYPDNLCKFNLEGEQRLTLGKPDVGVATSIIISPFDPNTIYIGGKGISVSRDGGSTWTRLNNGLGSTMLSLEAGVGDTGALFLLSGNCSMVDIEHGPNQSRRDIAQPLYISMNGGKTWDFSTQMGCYLIKDADGVTLYRNSEGVDWYKGGWLAMYWIPRSQDMGKSWGRELSTAPYTTITADRVRSGMLYLYIKYDRAEGVNYHQYISGDYGNIWKANNPEVDVKICYGSTLRFIDAYRPMAIDPSDGNHVFVIDNRTLLESHDSCNTTETFAAVPNTSMNSIAFDRNTSGTLYAGSDEGAYISFNSGATWHQINDGLLGATVVYSIAVDKDSNVYAATPYGIFKLENR